MKYIISILAIVLFQPPKIITLKDYYYGEGVIFDDKSIFEFEKIGYKSLYAPSLEDIIIGENFLFENYFDYEINMKEYFNLDKSKINTKYKNPENVKKKYKKYNRQYVACINKDNDTILYIGLLNFSNKKAKVYFDNWKEYVYGGAGDYYYKNYKSYVVNLSKKKFVYYVDGIEDKSNTPAP
jgi:hypothetical protein